jgi:two-component system invasion response regulator UvrY
MIRVLVCDGHRIVREGLQQLFADAGDIALAGEAGNGPEALASVRAAPAAVDVVLMDIALPPRGGIDLLKQARSEFPKLPVLMLSTYPDKQYAVRSLKLGAAGYLNKSADSEQMIGAIRQVEAGRLFITPAVAEQLAAAIGAGAAGEAPLHQRLSQDETQVFRLLAGGLSLGEIAEQLLLPSDTVSACRARILEKTGARNDVELALYAVHQDLLCT